MALSKEAIVSAARRILDEYGLADLSMRRVADALGVQPGALYYHIPNKQSLLAAVADEILAEIEPSCGLADWAASYRAVLLAHRDGAELVTSSRAMGLGAVDPAASVREQFPDPFVVTVLEHFILGATMHDQTRAQLAQLGMDEGFDPAEAQAAFDAGVELWLRGVGITIEALA